MTKDILLAIDSGTQSVRVMLFDLRGAVLGHAKVLIDPYVSLQPGWAEHEPQVFWDGLCRACHQLWQQGSVPREAIAGVSLTTMRSTLINVDRDGQPLRPAIPWLDQRRTEGLKPVGGWWGLLFAIAGMRETVAYLQAEAEANWIKTNQPEIWAKTYKFLFLSGYLTYRLVGRFVDSVGCQVGYIPFDYKAKTWAASSDWKWQAVPVTKDMLPDLVPPAQPLGEITPEAGAATGIPAGLPLIAAAADKACEVIGSGALESHIGCLSFGSAATINTTHRRYIEVIPLIPPYPSAVPDAYTLDIQVYRGFWMVSWFKREFGLLEQMLSEKEGGQIEALFDRLIDQVPPGAQGLTLQPYWSPGLKVPGPEARGAIIGWADAHTRAHLYRAIIEGLAYALREGKERTERRSHVPITELQVAGGGSQSDAAMQIAADVFGLPTSRPHTYEASGLGAAIDAAVGLGLHPDFETAVDEMTHSGSIFEPNPEAHRLYDELYTRVYSRMYGKLKPLYEALRDITA